MTDFKLFIYGGGRFRELEYRYYSIIVLAIAWSPNKVFGFQVIDIGSVQSVEVVG